MKTTVHSEEAIFFSYSGYDRVCIMECICIDVKSFYGCYWVILFSLQMPLEYLD